MQEGACDCTGRMPSAQYANTEYICWNEAEVCGLCANKDTRFGVRTIDGNDYYEKRCTKCHATLSYGQMKTGGGLFPKRKRDDGTWDTEHQGWYKWQAKSS